jgi:hypothetical protein
MLISLADMTTGWSVDPGPASHTSPCRGNDAGIVKTADRHTRFTDGQNDEVFSQAVMYQTAAMTRQVFSEATGQRYADCEARVFAAAARKGAGSNVTVGKAVAAQLHTDQLGDQAVAYRITIPMSTQGQSINILLDLIFFRSGRAVGFLADLGAGSIDDQQAADLARLMATRAPTTE